MTVPPARLMLGLIGTAALAALLAAERKRPLRRQQHPAMSRTIRNLAMGAMCASVIAMIETPLTRAVARGNVRRPRGLASQFPPPLRGVVAFLAMDYGFYIWHIMTHKVPLLWRLHRVHHIDPDMDASTAIRFHMLDMIVSLPWRMVQVRFSGISPGALNAWQHFFTASILFHHANLGLPAAWDRRLSRIITTPRMHGIHHSVVKAERDSNWSSGVSLWDHLHGTFRMLPPAEAIIIGVDDSMALADVPLKAALCSPFRCTLQASKP